MKIIYFFDSKRETTFMGFGQIVTLLQACYFRGKELGYDKIIFEWHNLVVYPGWTDDGTYKGIIQCPVNNNLPITIVPKRTKISKHADRIDLSEPNSLYLNCPEVMKRRYIMKPTHDYLNEYYQKYNIRPILSLPKDIKEKYILFHYRESSQERQLQRNTPYNDWKKLFELLKEKYGNEYKFKKFGEKSKLDDEFDEVFDYFPGNIERLFEIVNNSSLYVGGAAGPITLTFLFGIPGILLFDSKSKVSYIGETNAHRWLDAENYLYLLENEYDIDKDQNKIFDFIGGRNI